MVAIPQVEGIPVGAGSLGRRLVSKKAPLVCGVEFKEPLTGPSGSIVDVTFGGAIGSGVPVTFGVAIGSGVEVAKGSLKPGKRCPSKTSAKSPIGFGLFVDLLVGVEWIAETFVSLGM
jgi:hypothetical protein